MRVAILYSAVPENSPPEDQDTLVQVETVRAALDRLGHETFIILPCTLDLAALRNQLLEWRPDAVFNLVESLAEADSLVHLPPAVLDVLGIPYAGGRTEALFFTTHKLLAKQRLRQAGLPTPDWIEAQPDSNGEHGECRKHRWIIKGVYDQASRGMDDDSVLEDVDAAEIRRRLADRAAQSGRPCFAEQFIEGREFNISIVAGQNGSEVLPPAEIDFSAFPPGKPRIVGHRAKWQADSFEFNNTPRQFDFSPADAPLLDRLRSLTESCWKLFTLRGWARVDFRIDNAGRPWILEINSNPCLSPDAGFAAAIQQAGITFDDAMERILNDSKT